jgi:hypothetical protein
MGGAHPHALDAMKGLATGNRSGKSAERKQEILTPECILDVCDYVWPEGVALDPCAAKGRRTFAKQNIYGEQIDTGKRRKDGSKIFKWCGEGLTSDWTDRVFINPPYESLHKWLDKSESCVWDRAQEQILLVPVRTNRTWWCEYMSTVPTVIAWLRPLKFVGYDQAFPAPLVLVYTGERKDKFRAAVRSVACYVGGPL